MGDFKVYGSFRHIGILSVQAILFIALHVYLL